MHALVARGIMPIQMSYSGRNFDIVTGATAIVVATLAKKGLGGRRLAAWNVLGLALLVNVISVAIASMPLLRLFGDDRVVTLSSHPSALRVAAGGDGARRAGRAPRDFELSVALQSSLL